MPVHDNDRHAIVLDIGHAYTKCGFVGENEPRAIVASTVTDEKTGLVVGLHDEAKGKQLYDRFVKFFHRIFFKYLLVNHRERRVVLVESILCPTKFRETLAKVLFVHFEVPSIMFVPSHLVSLYTLGVGTALVMDVGYHEATIVPICDGTPIVHAWQALPLGSRAVHENLEKLMLKHCTVTEAGRTDVTLGQVIPRLSRSVLEDVTVRACFVTTLSRSRQIASEATAAVTPPPSVSYPLSGLNNVNISGTIREQACQVLFEMDADRTSLATAVLDAILASAIDYRVALAENLVVMGGGCMLSGFKSRLVAELKELQQHAIYRDKIALKSFKVHRPPAKANYVAWLGGAILGATEAISTRSYQRDAYMQSRHIPDWVNLADNAKDTDRTG